MKIGIFSNTEKDIDNQYQTAITKSIQRAGGIAELLHEDVLFDPLQKNDIELIICLGGDGTFLKASRKSYMYRIPVLGINMGKLGFLTEVEVDEIDYAVKRVLQGDFEVEERMILQGSIVRNGDTIYFGNALNEFVVAPGKHGHVLHVKTYMNGMYLDSYLGDGIIAASPTGSTAYSMSAGGPIVQPDTDIIIMTPICPHTLYARSFITAGNGQIQVEIDEPEAGKALLIADGVQRVEMQGGDKVTVCKSDAKMRIVKLGNTNFFETLRHKIYKREGNRHNHDAKKT